MDLNSIAPETRLEFTTITTKRLRYSAYTFNKMVELPATRNWKLSDCMDEGNTHLPVQGVGAFLTDLGDNIIAADALACAALGAYLKASGTLEDFLRLS